MATSEQVSGYLLEEVVAHLLARSGYRMLSVRDEPRALVWKGNGLRVRGRGAEHQADALGDLEITIPFTLPIRLFVEAKNTLRKVGLDVVRNAHGVVHDVNEFARAATDPPETARDLRRVQYRYSIFSTSGFTRDAQGFAFAHQISLIDMSGPSWGDLAPTLRRAARELVRRWPDERPAARFALRHALRRLEPTRHVVADRTPLVPPPVVEWAQRLATSVLAFEPGDILLGFVDAPFVLAMRVDDPDALRRATEGVSRVPVHIGFDGHGPLGGDWVVEHAEHADAFRLTFALPGVLEDILFRTPEDELRRAASDAKRVLMSTVTVYLDGAAVALQYQRVPSRSTGPVAETARDSTDLRSTLVPLVRRPDPGRHRIAPAAPPRPGRWSTAAVRELLERLESEERIQASLIREAARQGGTITREQIFEFPAFEQRRTLRGLARPSDRIRRQLVEEQLLSDDAARPFVAAYAEGAAAYGYEVPREIVRIMIADGLL